MPFEGWMYARYARVLKNKGTGMSSGDTFDEEKAIGNRRLDTMYAADFPKEAGKFLQVVFEDKTPVGIEYHPPFPWRNRTKVRISWVRESGDIKEVELRQFKEYVTKGIPRWEEQWAGPGEPMRLNHLTFAKLLATLKLVTELDIANLTQHRVALRGDDSSHMDAETKEKVWILIQKNEGLAMLDQLLSDGSITSRDLVNIGFRKQRLALFERLLTVDGAIIEYRHDHGIKGTQVEPVWQHFLADNDWIFGLGLDYRFLGILQREAHVGISDLANRDSPIVDFLMGAKDFTILVEVKKPATELFQKSINRAGSWQLSTDLIDAVSQILEQKAAWQVKAETHADRNFTREGKVQQATVDPKCILIVGRDAAFSGDERTQLIKRRTFELFRRDSRNVEILTYDELYQRAQFIVDHTAERQEAATKRSPF